MPTRTEIVNCPVCNRPVELNIEEHEGAKGPYSRGFSCPYEDCRAVSEFEGAGNVLSSKLPAAESES